MSAAATNVSWPEAGTQRRSLALKFMPSLTDFAFLLPVFLACFLREGPSLLLADGDTGWHIRTGDWILQHHAVPRTDLFSFTRAGQPWFAWEWGWDAAMSAIHRACGLPGVTFINLALLCLISALLFRLIRRSSGSDVLAFGLTILAICGTMIHWLARPHLVSWLFVLIFSHAIFSAERGDTKALRWLPVLTCLWTNLHGSFFVGIILLLTASAGVFLGELFAARPDSKRLSAAWPFFHTSLWCAVTSFINPYSWRLHQHVVSYLRDSKLMDSISEYQSISFHNPGAIFFELSLFLALATAGWCIARKNFGACLSALLWAHLALVSARSIPLFLLIVAPLSACMLAGAFESARTLPLFSKLGSEIAAIAGELRSLERVDRWHMASGLALLVIGVLFSSHIPRFASQFKQESFPVTAMNALEKSGASRIFTYDQWGDYLLYQFYPRQKVFMDGRSDFFGAEFVTAYQHIVSARYDCEQELQHFGIDTVLVKPDEALATVLKRSPRWKLLFDDGKAAIFRKILPQLVTGLNQKNFTLRLNSQERRSA